jgi:hypothetical protein
MGVLGFCWWNGSAHERWMGCIGWSHILGEKKNTKSACCINYVLLGTGLMVWMVWF